MGHALRGALPSLSIKVMKLRAGVLIIGSLLWDDRLRRSEWRASRLRMSGARRVSAPIRYGRYAEGRGTYTMVFSPALERRGELGTAQVVSYERTITSVTDLIEEAEELANAEGLHRETAAGEEPRWKTWGAIGVLKHPETRIAADLMHRWEKHFRNASAQCDLFTRPLPDGEQPFLSREGILDLRWPVCLDSGRPVDIDLLLATPTMPRLSTGVTVRYPTVSEIAAAYDAADDPTYFVENVRCGIRTDRDGAIWAEMRRLRPDWGERFRGLVF